MLSSHTMKTNYIRQILQLFFTNSFPDKMEEKIQKWIVNDRWTTEKELSLRNIWEDIKITPNRDTYQSLEKVKNTIKALEYPERQAKMRCVWFSCAAVILPVLLAIGSYLYLDRDVKIIEIKTSYNEHKPCTLPDGTTILLNSCTKLTYPSEFNDTARVVTLEGEAYFSVTRDTTKPFIVKTSELSIKVLGTKFNVSAYPTNDHSTATLNSGSIQVDTRESGNKYILKPHEEIIFNKIDQSVSLNTVTTDGIGWKNGWLVFQDATFNDMMNTLRHRYNVSIEYNKQAFANIPYTVKFVHNESVEEVLNVLQDVTGGFNYRIKGRHITITKKEVKK